MTDAREIIERVVNNIKPEFRSGVCVADAIFAEFGEAGLVIVPREATEEMVDAAYDRANSPLPSGARNLWASMVAAAIGPTQASGAD